MTQFEFERVRSLVERLEWGLVPAVPVPFRGDAMDVAAQRGYAAWMGRQPVAGVAVWAHTGRGPHLSADQRGGVLEAWREAMPDRIIVAGARDITMAIEARRGRADALLAFPQRDDPVKYHARLSRELPVVAFWLYRRGRKLKGRLAKLPYGEGWTRFRDFPAPLGKTFQSQWRGARRHRRGAP